MALLDRCPVKTIVTIDAVKQKKLDKPNFRNYINAIVR